ncbi:MAG TPA: tetratricopeptide repeat protein [Chthonomonadaceae bacterium]|nr:tetratricopeptide repeat protein [Chthonomonadaceae bacterium]
MFVGSSRSLLYGATALFLIAAPACLLAQGTGAPAHAAPPANSKASKSAPVIVRPTVPPEVQKAAAQFMRAVALHKAGKVKEAIPAYQQFLRLAAAAHMTPQQTLPAYQNLTSLYEFQGDRKGLEDALQHIVAADPKNVRAYIGLATLTSGQRRFAEAERYARKALALSPPANLAAPAHFVLGTAAAVRGDNATAETEYAASTRLAPTNAQAQFDYAIILGRRHKFRQALAVAEKVHTLAPDLTAALLYIGDLKTQLKDYPGALAVYQAALKKEPHNPIALFNDAMLLQRLAHIQEAISAYLDVIRVAPNNEAAYLNLGQLYDAILNFPAAKRNFTSALKLAPKDGRALAGLAFSETQDAFTLIDTNQRSAELKQAEAHYKQAIALKPINIPLENELGNLYERAGRYVEALAIYKRHQAADPDNIEPYRQMARVYTMQHDAGKVLETWHAYRQRRPDDPNSYMGAARILEAETKYEEAAAEWKALLARQPKDGNAMVALGQDLALLKRRDEARAQFSAVLALDATGADVPDPKARPMVTAAIQAEQLDAMRGLADLADAEGKTDEAISWWSKVQAKEAAAAGPSGHSEDPKTYQAIARLYEKAKQPDKALQEYQAMAQALPKDPTPYDEIARIDEAQGRFEPAADAYRQAATRAEDPLGERIKAAELYRRHNMLDKALAEYEQLERSNPSADPNDSRIYGPMAQIYEQSGQDEKALAAYDTLLKRDPSAGWAQDRKAIVLSRLKRYDDARALYEKEIDRTPETYQTYADLARIYELEGKPDAYLAWLQARLEKTPDNATLMAALIDAYTRQKREEAGWAVVKGIVDKHKDQRSLQEAYATLLARKDRNAEALEVFRQIAAAHPDDLDAQTTLAAELDRNNKPEEANALFEQMIARPALSVSQRVGLRRLLAQRYVQQGKLPQAIAQLQEAHKADPNDFLVSAGLAKMLVQTGKESEALPLYTELLQHTDYPEAMRAQIRDDIAAIYEKQGRKAEAIGQFKEALKLNPDDTDAAAGLKRLGAQ